VSGDPNEFLRMIGRTPVDDGSGQSRPAQAATAGSGAGKR
jgi:hypothetical protein